MKNIVLNGGLGNQLFQIVEAFRLKSNGVDVCIDTSVISRCWFQKYFLRQRSVEPYYKYFTLNSEIMVVNKKKTIFYVFISKVLGRLSGGLIRMVDDNTSGKSCYHMGYWQNIDVAKKYTNFFSFINDLFPEANNEIAQLMAESNSLAVHVRRGDYLLKKNSYFASCTTNYYKAAMSLFESARIFVFSDDIDWAKGSGLFPNDTVYVNHNTQDNAHMDMYLMSVASNIVICNSTFSVWGALLGVKEKVIAPKYYYVNSENHLTLPCWCMLDN
ncbi:alpha-1,2-fucosyltransferase [Saccharospirillum sp. HFRX-1]|uniref:alpha-1,2-fucosyltransferase n=1 Tax=unclassified Saccharospirillum TaxID=2633430 RepID=UPI00371DD97B